MRRSEVGNGRSDQGTGQRTDANGELTHAVPTLSHAPGSIHTTSVVTCPVASAEVVRTEADMGMNGGCDRDRKRKD